MANNRRLPPWFKVPLGSGDHYKAVRQALAAQGLNTVCSSARCPNLGECWSAGTATFMILGNHCTRNCAFCAVDSSEPEPLDMSEAIRLRQAVSKLGLKYVVITSVTRDDLINGGAELFAEVIRELRSHLSAVRVEVLIPDFQGSANALDIVLNANPDVLNHNVETVKELYDTIRPQADYQQSLTLLSRTSERLGSSRTKSGLMVGLGETHEQLKLLLSDLRSAGVGRLTVGQYLQPTRKHIPVQRYVSPEEFKDIEIQAKQMGFTHVSSGPLVRSSYHAEEMND